VVLPLGAVDDLGPGWRGAPLDTHSGRVAVTGASALAVSRRDGAWGFVMQLLPGAPGAAAWTTASQMMYQPVASISDAPSAAGASRNGGARRQAAEASAAWAVHVVTGAASVAAAPHARTTTTTSTTTSTAATTAPATTTTTTSTTAVAASKHAAAARGEQLARERSRAAYLRRQEKLKDYASSAMSREIVAAVGAAIVGFTAAWRFGTRKHQARHRQVVHPEAGALVAPAQQQRGQPPREEVFC